MLPIGALLRQVRRSVDVEPDTNYREIGIRSHCKGTFHKPVTTGKQIGEKRVFWVEAGQRIVVRPKHVAQLFALVRKLVGAYPPVGDKS